MKILFYLFIVSLIVLFIGYSAAQTSGGFTNDYMPLAIGNKWYYNVHTSNNKVGSETTFSTEVIGIDTIETKVYFKIERENSNDKIPVYYYHQRVSNDTLYTLNFDQKSNLYFERITAIFNLDSGDVAEIELPPNELSSKNEAEGLPTGRRYSIKATDKDENKIEFFTYSIIIDGEFSEIYQKGVGMINSKNAWGIVTELIEYDFNN
jgi:hypothetical protein